jgi:hypothetical protein
MSQDGDANRSARENRGEQNQQGEVDRLHGQVVYLLDADATARVRTSAFNLRLRFDRARSFRCLRHFRGFDRGLERLRAIQDLGDGVAAVFDGSDDLRGRRGVVFLQDAEHGPERLREAAQRFAIRGGGRRRFVILLAGSTGELRGLFAERFDGVVARVVFMRPLIDSSWAMSSYISFDNANWR